MAGSIRAWTTVWAGPHRPRFRSDPGRDRAELRHLQWFGKLPGDIRIEGEDFPAYIPITSMLLISVGLSLLLNLISRLF